MPQAGQEATRTYKPITECPKNMSETGYRCVCLNARSIINKKNELNIKVEDIDPHIISMMMNRTAIECWNIIKYEIESIIDKCVPLKNKENGLERNTCQKKLLEK